MKILNTAGATLRKMLADTRVDAQRELHDLRYHARNIAAGFAGKPELCECLVKIDNYVLVALALKNALNELDNFTVAAAIDFDAILEHQQEGEAKWCEVDAMLWVEEA